MELVEVLLYVKADFYIRWEMTPTSISGGRWKLVSVGVQSPIWYTLREDAHVCGKEGAIRRPAHGAQDSQASLECMNAFDKNVWIVKMLNLSYGIITDPADR